MLALKLSEQEALYQKEMSQFANFEINNEEMMETSLYTREIEDEAVIEELPTSPNIVEKSEVIVAKRTSQAVKDLMQKIETTKIENTQTNNETVQQVMGNCIKAQKEKSFRMYTYQRLNRFRSLNIQHFAMKCKPFFERNYNKLFPFGSNLLINRQKVGSF